MSTELESPSAPIQPKKRKWPKRLLWICVILLLLFGVMFFTRPEKAKHEEKIRELAIDVVNQKMEDQNVITKSITKIFGPFLVDKAVDLFFEVDDYYIFNLGRIKYQDTDQPITIGLFNHAFALASKETVIKKLDEAAAEKDLKIEEEKQMKKELKKKQKQEKKELKLKQKQEKKELKEKLKKEKKELKEKLKKEKQEKREQLKKEREKKQ